VGSLLASENLLRLSASGGQTQFMATDGVERFARVAQIFLGYPIAKEQVELVTVIPTIISTVKKAG